jgi:hypothetical protein
MHDKCAKVETIISCSCYLVFFFFFFFLTSIHVILLFINDIAE